MTEASDALWDVIREARDLHRAVKGSLSDAEMRISIGTSRLSDPDLPHPPGDPIWLTQAAESTSNAIEECSNLQVMLHAMMARLRTAQREAEERITGDDAMEVTADETHS